MSELYELPNGWEWKTFEDKLVLIQNGLSDTQNDDGIGYPISRIETIQNETIDSNRIKYIDTNDNSIIEKYRYDYGDLLFSHINSFEKVGKVCLYTNQIENLLHGVNLLRMKFTDDINSKFVFYYLISNVSRRFYEPNIKKAINQASINQKNIKSIPLPFPPLSEQQRIVSKLDKLFEKIDKAIALHQKNIDEANVFMASVLNDVFGELEEKYPLRKVSDGLKNILTGTTPPKNEDKYYENPSINWFSPSDFGKSKVLSDSKNMINPIALKDKKAKMYEKSTLLLVAIGATVGKIGVIREEASSNQQITAMKFKDDIDVDFSYYWFYYIKQTIINTASAATLPIINQNGIKDLKFIIPPLQIQQKVVKYLDEISEKIEKVKSIQKEKMDSLKALKASILDKAFRGEL